MKPENLRNAVQELIKIENFFRSDQMRGAVTTLLQAYTMLTEEYSPFKVGQRVRLFKTPEISTTERWGWMRYKSFLKEGVVGLVEELNITPTGRLLIGVRFPNLTQSDGKGEQTPVTKPFVLNFEPELLELSPVKENRKAFEDWMRGRSDHFEYVRSLPRLLRFGVDGVENPSFTDDDGRYHEDSTQLAWEAWQSRGVR